MTLDPTAFFAVHLDAQSEEKRVEQLKKCLDRARALGTRNAVLAGDMNTECLPGSCVQAMISREPVTQEQMARECASALRLKGDEEEDSEGAVGAKGAEGSSEPSEEQLEQWRVLWDKAAVAPREQRIELLRVPTGGGVSFDLCGLCGKALMDFGPDVFLCRDLGRPHPLFL